MPLPVLDFANGYQKETHEEVDQVEENCRLEDEGSEEAGKERKSCQEIDEQSYSEKAQQGRG